METSMKESETKTKWCPFVRMSPQSAINNRGDNHPNAGNVNCIGSQCMAWRWGFREDDKDAEITSGYCGLAGKP